TGILLACRRPIFVARVRALKCRRLEQKLRRESVACRRGSGGRRMRRHIRVERGATRERNRARTDGGVDFGLGERGAAVEVECAVRKHGLERAAAGFAPVHAAASIHSRTRYCTALHWSAAWMPFVFVRMRCPAPRRLLVGMGAWTRVR